ncbi:MAG TPA: DegQ family serine endoprotease [Devosiaceae bacterium]|jgi:serine protease Do
MTSRTVLLASGFVVVAAIGVAAGVVLAPGGSMAAPAVITPQGAATTVQVAAPSPERQIPDSQQQVQLSFAPVVKAVTPSVVNVYATTVTKTQSPFANDPFFQRFFRGGTPFDDQPRESKSLGSGVIVDPSGIILTNSHVVHGATDVRIATSDGREYAVDVVLDDAKTDLATLKIKDPAGHQFPALPFADSDQLQVGDLVLAIGNPFGVGQTVTSGIVSALARTGVESNNYEFFIQTDAAINPGNSGGALVDLRGHLVGINTAIFSQSGGSVGIGFAIPANMAKVVANAGINGGTIVRPWFGARTQDVTADIADSIGLDHPHGALITEVAPDSPAERAGFKAGDVILDANGVPIDQASALDFRIATMPVGQTASIGFWRDRQQQTVNVKLEAAPGSDGSQSAAIDGNTRFAGATVETISPAVAQDLGLAFNAKGVVVTAVDDGSSADDMGLEKGDIILSLNGKDIPDAATFKSVAGRRANTWQIVLQRGGRTFRTMVSG